MEEAIAQCRGDQLSYMEISVDDLRLYNELYGMAHGDKILQLVSTIIKKTVPRGVFCGRLAGKEFGICMPHRPQMEAVKLAENIREQLDRSDPGAGRNQEEKNHIYCRNLFNALWSNYHEGASDKC